MAANTRSLKLWWSVPIAAVLLLLGLAMVLGEGPEPIEVGTSYDASFKGFRAAYLLLQELGYPVVRSRRPTGGAARWVLFPSSSTADAPILDNWVRDGGAIVLAVGSAKFAGAMGIELKVRELDSDPGDEPASGAGIARIAGGRVRVEWPDRPGRVWVRAGGTPVVTAYDRGRGEVWLVNRPEILTNGLLGKADNGVLVCRLAEQVLRRRSGPLVFDEYVHGLRDRPGVTRLLLRPPALWVTLEALLLMGLLLGHYAPRFGAPRPPAPSRRRSKEEFLDAMASLLDRKGDYADAFRTARDALARAIERELGLPPATPPGQVAAEAARRRRIDAAALARVLTTEALPAGAGPAGFVHAMNELETAHDEFFQRRSHR